MCGGGNRRLAALNGLALIALSTAALFLPAPPPQARDSAQHTAHTLATHRPRVLAGAYAAGLAVVALPFFLGSVESWLAHERADDAPARAAVAAAVLGMAAQLVALLLFYGATFKVAGEHEYSLVRALTDGG